MLYPVVRYVHINQRLVQQQLAYLVVAQIQVQQVHKPAPVVVNLVVGSLQNLQGGAQLLELLHGGERVLLQVQEGQLRKLLVHRLEGAQIAVLDDGDLGVGRELHRRRKLLRGLLKNLHLEWEVCGRFTQYVI